MSFFRRSKPAANVEAVDDTQALENLSKVESRLLRLNSNRELSYIFDQLVALPVCVEIESMSVCRRGMVNALNGMTLIIDETNDGETALEIRTIPNSIGGSDTTYCYTALTVAEAQKILALWTFMSKPLMSEHAA
jgi:hypothetical protein